VFGTIERFAQELLQTEVKDLEVFPYPSEQASLECEEGEGGLLGAGFMDKFKLSAIFQKAVDVNEST